MELVPLLAVAAEFVLGVGAVVLVAEVDFPLQGHQLPPHLFHHPPVHLPLPRHLHPLQQHFPFGLQLRGREHLQQLLLDAGHLMDDHLLQQQGPAFLLGGVRLLLHPFELGWFLGPCALFVGVALGVGGFVVPADVVGLRDLQPFFANLHTSIIYNFISRCGSWSDGVWVLE